MVLEEAQGKDSSLSKLWRVANPYRARLCQVPASKPKHFKSQDQYDFAVLSLVPGIVLC